MPIDLWPWWPQPGTHLVGNILALTTSVLLYLLYRLNLFYRFLQAIPGPKLYALTKWRLAHDDWTGIRTRRIHALHQHYGPIIRVGPNELSFCSLSALKTIYGAGSGFERTSFYRMFDVYGEQNLFTFAGVREHAGRKKLLVHAYSKSSILKNYAPVIEDRVEEFLQLLEREPDVSGEIFASLHYYSLDSITHFLYGEWGATRAMRGRIKDREMLNDVLDPKRRKLAWFAVHFPRYTRWLMSRTGVVEKVIAVLGLLPQRKPTVYTGIRKHALESWERFADVWPEGNSTSSPTTIIERLGEQHISKKENGLTDMQVASEAADHLLAGVDTTADTLLFLIWALSLPSATAFQQKLIQEVRSLPDSSIKADGNPIVAATDKLPYLDAVIKETLRLYAPLPASEPRCLPVDCVIDGVLVRAGTVVSMAPYEMHRNVEVFRDPLVFNPERWLGDEEEVMEMRRWFWAFSSGGRMCIGLQSVFYFL